MAASPRSARDKARKAHSRARQADQAYRRAKTQAKRGTHRQARKAKRASGRAASVESHHWLARTVGVVGYLAVGAFPYLASGLLVPPGAVMVLMALWLLGLVWTLRIARHNPRWTPAAPVVAVLVWIILVQAGSAVFGWTA